jgi:hypothetical protein
VSPVKVVRQVSPPFTVAMPAAALIVHAAAASLRVSTPVPIYLRKVSLLI